MFNIETLIKNNIEVINPTITRGRIRFALFDFDGTLSLIREGWQDIMIPMMIEILKETPHHEEDCDLENVVTDFVTKLTGKQTIYQMIQLCLEIDKRGGSAQDPFFYKKIYIDRLNKHIKNKLSGLKDNSISPEKLMVPGALDWLRLFQARGIQCVLASGTDEKDVYEEVELLGLTSYFIGIHGAKEDYEKYSKKMVIETIITKYHLAGVEFSVFGDGFVEIEDSKSVGGIAIGLATNEKDRTGIDEWKRNRLISAGADLIIPDFRCASTLEAYLFEEM